MQAMPRNQEEKILALANVVGVGVGYKNGTGDVCYVVNVSKKLPLEALHKHDVVPPEVDGQPTDVVEVGVIRPLELPAKGGDSIGHFAITAGTLGAVVHQRGQPVVLSNNHVIANSNDAAIGDQILHPGPHDGGNIDNNTFALLSEFVPISFFDLSQCVTARAIAFIPNALAKLFRRKTRLQPVSEQQEDNLVDAAVAVPISPEFVASDIRGIGVPTGTASAELGTALQKSGRTTGLTFGTVTQTGVTIQVQYGLGKLATFRDQVIASPMGEPGDSGSVMVNDQNQLVGLLFAGSDQATVFNRIEHVFDALDLEV